LFPAKLEYKFIGLMVKVHNAIDNNESLPEHPTWDPWSANPFVEYNDQNETPVLSDLTFASDDSFSDNK
jgi:hypothetical protein